MNEYAIIGPTLIAVGCLFAVAAGLMWRSFKAEKMNDKTADLTGDAIVVLIVAAGLLFIGCGLAVITYA